jgi:glutamine amidotransferase
VRVAIFDYGAGNLHSLAKAVALAPGVEVRVETDPARAADADALVLPGVGAFGQAAARLAPGLDAVRGAVGGGLPVLGICLGMQLLLAGSDEGPGAGLGVIPGRVVRLRGARVPQIGWNALVPATESSGVAPDPLLARAPLDVAYYANSFICRPDSPACVGAWSEHEGERYPAMVRAGRVVGVQFHPEKSSAPGVRFVHAWLEEACRA